MLKDLNIKGDISHYTNSIKIFFERLNKISIPYSWKFIKLWFCHIWEILDYHHLRTLCIIIWMIMIIDLIIAFFTESDTFKGFVISSTVFLAIFPLVLTWFLDYPYELRQKHNQDYEKYCYEKYLTIEEYEQSLQNK